MIIIPWFPSQPTPHQTLIKLLTNPKLDVLDLLAQRLQSEAGYPSEHTPQPLTDPLTIAFVKRNMRHYEVGGES